MTGGPAREHKRLQRRAQKSVGVLCCVGLSAKTSAYGAGGK